MPPMYFNFTETDHIAVYSVSGADLLHSWEEWFDRAGSYETWSGMSFEQYQKTGWLQMLRSRLGDPRPSYGSTAEGTE